MPGATTSPTSRCLPGEASPTWSRLKGTKEIGDGINKVIGRLADANDYLLKGVIDQADFNDESKLGKGKEMQDRLSKLVGIFEGLDFRANRAHGDDLLGDAYEYLMRHFATQSGKSKGQFYTPAEVSRIMAQVIGIGPDTRRDHTVYDPTCGSGSLLIKAADEAPHGLTDLRPGEGCRDVDDGAHEHDPARTRGRRDQARQHARRPSVHGGTGGSQTVRLRGRQSAVLRQGLDERPRPGPRRIPPLRIRRAREVIAQ